MRAFFAHPKSWDNDLIDAAAAETADALRPRLGAVSITSGRDDYQANIAAEGNISGWCRSVTRRKDVDGRRWYDLIAVPKAETIGKATAGIVEDALQARITVVQVEFQDDGSVGVERVSGVEVLDAEDYISGWSLRIDEN